MPNMLQAEAGIIFTRVSDHLPYFMRLVCEYKRKPNHPGKVKTRINTQQAKENLLSDLLRANIIDKMDSNLRADPNINYEVQKKAVLDLKNRHMPYRFVKFNSYRHKKSKWITYGLIKSIKFRDGLYQKLQKTVKYSLEYTSLKQRLSDFNLILRKSIREAKISYYNATFQKYKNDIKNTRKTISEVLCKSHKHRPSFDKILVGNRAITDKIEIAKHFNEFFVNIGPNLASEIITENKRPYSTYLRETTNAMFKFNLVDVDHVKKKISLLHPKPSAGPDGLSLKLTKYLAPALVNPLTIIINQSLTTGIFPDKLKISKAVPLHKTDDIHLMNNYRPVSLLNSISKIFEKVVFEQLYKYFQEHKLFFNSQYGFRKLHSTQYAALELIDRTMHDIDNKHVSLALYMDMSKAFDTLDHSILIHKLHCYGIKNSELGWFESYLRNRTQYVEINHIASDLLLVKTGVPQGSILGPLLFLIYMNDITKACSSFKYILYADDTTLYTTIQSTEDLSNINNELSKISDWLAVNKLSLNANKTKYMIFHAMNKDLSHLNQRININNVEIPKVNQFHFLGLTIDENLSWNHHISAIANKISKGTGVINRLKNCLPLSILRTIYCSLIQSHFDYTILAWGFEAQRLSKIQKRAVRAITLSKYNAHSEPLLKLVKLLSVTDLFNLNSLKCFYNYKHNRVPEYFQQYDFRPNEEIHTYPTRQGGHIPANVTRLNMTQKCLRNDISKKINATPAYILDKIRTHSLHGFSANAKDYFISRYSQFCTIANCYICHQS